MPELIPYIVFFILTFGFTVVINKLLLKFSKTLGTRNPDQNEIRWNANIKPSIGGISFFIVFLLGIAGYAIYRQAEIAKNIQILGLLFATTMGFLIGLADDAYNTRPFLKFVGQLLCAFVLIYTGTYIQISEHLWLNYALTAFWVIALMNSINMLDNMDAIATTVSLFVLVPVLLLMPFFHGTNETYFFMVTAVVASLSGFLIHNWNPSKMFMGDTGSQFLGIFLAGIGIVFFWNANNMPVETSGFKQLILVITAFSLPITDTSTVVIKRLMKKRSPFVGGKDHTTHCLGYAGLSDKQVAIVFAGISLLNVASVYLIYQITVWTYGHTFMFLILPTITFIVLFFIAMKYKNASE